MERIVALYLRLSKADKWESSTEEREDREDTEEFLGISGKASMSIQNQQTLLEQYVRQEKELCGYEKKVFIDDGFSGLEEKRPALQGMLSMVRRGEVYAVLVKDFSRLSRNHLYLAALREQIFPSCKTELIALGDGYDSRNKDGNMLALRFKSLFYEYYSRDISRKVKASLKAKKERGEYAVAKPPYGYRMENGSWRIEEPEAEVIRAAFRMGAEGASYSRIASELEPMAAPGKLYPVKVMRILSNPVYCGRHVWHKYENYIGTRKKSVALPKEQWRIEAGKHPAIISEELFEKVGAYMKK